MAAVPRPLLIALVAAVLAATAFYATRGGAAPPPTAPSATQEAAPKPLSPNPPSKQNAAPSKSASGATPKAGSKASAKATDPKSSQSPAKPKAKPKAAPANVQERVSRSLGHRVVVLFFRQRVGADDAATGSAVRSVSGMKGVAVFSDGIGHLRRYPRLIARLGITQAPSVVVIGKNRQAQLIEGYVDSGTLRQQVVDAR